MESGKSEKCQNQFGRLAHYHYATPASNAPPSYTSNRLSVKSKPRRRLTMRPSEALQHAAWRHNGVRHAMEDFLIGGANSGQDAAELRVVDHHEVVRAEPYPRAKCPHFIRLKIGILRLEELRFFKALQDKGMRRKAIQCLVDGFGPFAGGQIVTDVHAEIG